MMVALAMMLFVGCHRDAPAVAFHADGYPQKLSDWHVVYRDGDRLALNAGVVPFDLNMPLFSDYAHKLRTVWMPAGTHARYVARDAFDLPVGTILSKTFFYPKADGGADAVARTYDERRDRAGSGLDLRHVRMIETRLLVHRKRGWVALAYVWNAQQTEAELARTGDSVALELVGDDGGREAFTYQVPDQNQCAGCHASNNTTRAIQPLGPKARHLNRDYAYDGVSENQLAHWARIGYLTDLPSRDVPRNANWRDEHAALDDRARAYLDVNCGHCHNARGPADTSGLLLDIGDHAPRHLGLCKPPVAAGRGTGGRHYGIVPGDPDASVLAFRIDSDDPGVMMPELGRDVVHREGVALIRAWIAAMEKNDCGDATPATAANGATTPSTDTRGEGT